MKVDWAKFDGVEVQVFQPDGGSSSAIVFCPGYPGMGATVFEQRHAAALVDEGFCVYVIKHKGTKLSGALAPVMVNNASRLMQGRKKNETHLGGGPATVEEWMIEPLKVLNALDPLFNDIHIIGNSFGALAALWSLTDKAAFINKVRSVLLYAGAQGIDDGTEDGIMRVWKPEFLMMPRLTDKVTMNDPFDVVSTLQNAYRSLPERMKALPEKIGITYLVVEGDEILRLADTQAFQAAVGGRGKIVIDTVDHAWPEHGLLAHDTPNYKTEDLLKLIRG